VFQREVRVLSIETAVGSVQGIHVLLQQRDGVLTAILLLYDLPSGQADALLSALKAPRMDGRVLRLFVNRRNRKGEDASDCDSLLYTAVYLMNWTVYPDQIAVSQV